MSQDQQNHNEIDDILNEVEELRRELSTEAQAVDTQAVAKEVAAVLEGDSSAPSVPAVSEDLMKEFHASLEGVGSESDSLGADESMESTLAELKDDPTVKTLLDQTFDDQVRRQKEAPVMQAPDTNTLDTNTEASPSLTMSLTGSMTLRLKYEFGGQEVTVGFTDEYLKVELADGTEFKIPVGRQKALRRVA